MQIEHLKEVDSTNNYVVSLLKNRVLEHGFCVRADFQSAGKGQTGNHWEAATGENLLFSICLKADKIIASQQFLLSKIVSVSLVNVLRRYAPSVKIKWPNDIFFRNKKLAGILIETFIKNSKVEYAIVGIGLNVNQLKFAENKETAVSLRAITGKKFDLNDLLTQIVDEILINYERFNYETIRMFENQYFKQLIRTDNYYPYKTKSEIFLAKITDVATNGRLSLLTSNSKRRWFLFKQVEFVIY